MTIKPLRLKVSDYGMEHFSIVPKETFGIDVKDIEFDSKVSEDKSDVLLQVLLGNFMVVEARVTLKKVDYYDCNDKNYFIIFNDVFVKVSEEQFNSIEHNEDVLLFLVGNIIAGYSLR